LGVIQPMRDFEKEKQEIEQKKSELEEKKKEFKDKKDKARDSIQHNLGELEENIGKMERNPFELVRDGSGVKDYYQNDFTGNLEYHLKEIKELMSDLADDEQYLVREEEDLEEEEKLLKKDMREQSREAYNQFLRPIVSMAMKRRQNGIL